MITKELIERFQAKYVVDRGGCWLWTASTAGKGYGQIKIPGTRRQIYAHQLSYLYHKGAIPDGMMVCHSCDTPRCVNPDHLFLGSGADNLRDMKAKDRHLRGTRNAKVKLSDADVETMYDMREGGFSTYEIARTFGVCQMTAWNIVNGRRWEHLYKRRYGK